MVGGRQSTPCQSVLAAGKAGENGQYSYVVSERSVWTRPSATSGREPFGNLSCRSSKEIPTPLDLWSLSTGSPAGRLEKCHLHLQVCSMYSQAYASNDPASVLFCDQVCMKSTVWEAEEHS